jgi:RNA polymerase sigma-70 factor (ECF subfamily)
MAWEKSTKTQQKEKFCQEALMHLDHLYRLALHFVRESNEAKDLVQETYSRAIGSYEQFSPGSNMKAWLTKILCNFFFHDRKQKRKWVSAEDNCGQDKEASDYWGQITIEHHGPEAEMLLKERKGKIIDVLNKIPEEFRMPIILVIMGDFSYQEAAEMLSCPVGTIRSRIFRGRKLVYKGLKEYMGVEETTEENKWSAKRQKNS